MRSLLKSHINVPIMSQDFTQTWVLPEDGEIYATRLELDASMSRISCSGLFFFASVKIMSKAFWLPADIIVTILANASSLYRKQTQDTFLISK